jgi:transaldolase
VPASGGKVTLGDQIVDVDVPIGKRNVCRLEELLHRRAVARRLAAKAIEKTWLCEFVERGEIRGVTSNPTIFMNAITKSHDYDDSLLPLIKAGLSDEEIFFSLAIEDIQAAADLFRPLYDKTSGGDGYVSLEVNPHVARNTAETVSSVRHLFSVLNRPNVMIKVPATPEGIPAIEQLLSEGINVNITLIFSLMQYQAVAEAYLNGLERFQKAGGNIRKIASVASFFVSRIDTKADKRLEQAGNTDLLGHIAIDNAKLAYARFRAIFSSERRRSRRSCRTTSRCRTVSSLRRRCRAAASRRSIRRMQWKRARIWRQKRTANRRRRRKNRANANRV